MGSRRVKPRTEVVPRPFQEQDVLFDRLAMPTDRSPSLLLSRIKNYLDVVNMAHRVSYRQLRPRTRDGLTPFTYPTDKIHAWHVCGLGSIYLQDCLKDHRALCVS